MYNIERTCTLDPKKVHHQKSAATSLPDLTDGPVIVLFVVGVVPTSYLLFLLLLLEPEAAERRLGSCRALGSLLLRGIT